MEEMNALEQKVNLTLFQDLMAFILDTAKVHGSQVYALHERCIIPFTSMDNGEFQKKYGFMYLGELLERYEERFGMALPDLRAIALALGYTKDLVPEEMFMGTQRIDFLKKVRKSAAGDIYLTGALYLLYEGQSGAGEYEMVLRQVQYGKTEDILFALSVFSNTEESFLHFKPQLLHLLGKSRNIPIFGNMKLLVWLILRIQPLVKNIRTKDIALFRALCSLPISFVKQGDKHYELLSKAGYSSLEIAYANMQTISLAPAADRLSWNSIVTEKILVNLFREVFRAETPLTLDVYDQLAVWLKQYETFPIKCYGQDKLLAALNYGEKIKNPETFRWFAAHAPLSHSAFQGFDIMDPHWNGLASTMEYTKYTELFDIFLDDKLSMEEITARVARFDLLTGKNYINYGAERAYWSNFGMLVDKGMIDLWQAFQDSLDANGMPAKPKMLNHIKSYIRKMATIQAFRFYESFLPKYGFQGLKTYFNNEYLFRDSVASRSSYSCKDRSGSSVELRLEREYLNDDMRRLLLYWLSEYFWELETEYYLPLTAEILDKKAVAGLFPHEEQRALFDVVMIHPSLIKKSTARLKERYLTAEEKEAERKKQETLKQEHERQERLALEEEVQDKFDEMVDGTMASLLAFIGEYRYEAEQREAAETAIYEYLLRMEGSQTLDESECVCLLKLCTKLVKNGKMRFEEAQKLINMIKEAPCNGETDTGSCAG